MNNYVNHKASNLTPIQRVEMAERMFDAYETKQGADGYRFAFDYAGIIYIADMTADDMRALLVLDTASRGNGYSIRAHANNRIKYQLVNNGAVARIACADFEAYKAQAIKSGRCGKGTPNGHILEMLECDRLGIVWTQDNAGFEIGGDISENGIEWQYKMQYKGNNPTFANERKLHNLGVWE